MADVVHQLSVWTILTGQLSQLVYIEYTVVDLLVHLLIQKFTHYFLKLIFQENQIENSTGDFAKLKPIFDWLITSYDFQGRPFRF